MVKVLLLIGVLSAWPRGVAAQDANAAKSLAERVAALEQGVQGTAVAGPEGFALKSTDGNFELKLRGSDFLISPENELAHFTRYQASA